MTRSDSHNCPECSGIVRRRDAEAVCENCGLVVSSETIDRGPEWRSLDGGTDGRRTGAPLRRSRHDKGLSTEIGYGTGSAVSGERRRQLVRMRTQHNRARLSSKRERNRLYAFTEIRRLVSAMSLAGSVREQACALFESAQSEGLLRGRSLEGFSAASVYATCRTRSIARTLDDVVTDARADESECQAAYDALNRELGLPASPIEPSEYLPRYASDLDVAMDVEHRARECVDLLREAGEVGGKKPSGVAAACLYKAADDHGVGVTQGEAADLADVSLMTIRSTVTDLRGLA